MKSKVSPLYLTYFMLKWDEVGQEITQQKCTECGRFLSKTETVEDEKGQKYEGYVCHTDKRVTWIRLS